MYTTRMYCCQRELADVLDETVAAILRRGGMKRPPVNAVLLARRLGYPVLWDDHQVGRARVAAVRSGPGRRPRPAIFLRRDPRPERIQWAVAHEIGEQLTAEVCRRLRIDAADLVDSREQIASALATRLLLPGKWFSREAIEMGFDILRLKTRFATASHELVARRLLDLPTPVLVTIFDHGKLEFRRWNCPRRPPPMSPLEWQLWRGAHESGQATCNAGPPRIDAWPIHEPGWKREIMRLELAGDDSQLSME
jgi:hypothetical protein